MAYNAIGDQLERIAKEMGWEVDWRESDGSYDGFMEFRRGNDVLVSGWRYSRAHDTQGSRWFPCEANVVTEECGMARTYAEARGLQMDAVNDGRESIHMWQYIFGFITYHLSIPSQDEIDESEFWVEDLARLQGEGE